MPVQSNASLDAASSSTIFSASFSSGRIDRSREDVSRDVEELAKDERGQSPHAMLVDVEDVHRDRRSVTLPLFDARDLDQPAQWNFDDGGDFGFARNPAFRRSQRRDERRD